jgi:hypothetical protein
MWQSKWFSVAALRDRALAPRQEWPHDAVQARRGALFNALLGSIVGLSLAATMASPAHAAIIWPTPPQCADAMWHWTGQQLGFYQKAYEYKERRLYGGGMEIRYIWVWEVYAPTIRGLIPAGSSSRHCGTDWTSHGA